MKKKIISLLILSIYFFGGFGMVFAEDDSSNGTMGSDPNSGYSGPSLPAPDEQSPRIDIPSGPNGEMKTNPEGFDEFAGHADVIDKNAADDKTRTSAATPTGKTGGGPNDMTSTSFSLNPNELSPSEKKYTGGTKVNFKTLLSNIGKYLLIATTTIAVLSIVIGGIMISTTGPTDRAAKGKTIIMLNIGAVLLALFSYSIIQLVSWLIA